VTSSRSSDTPTSRAGATLHVVSTPIGNLGDVSRRAAEVLARVGLIACEDTRRTAKLLTHLGIPRPALVVANEHTEAAVAARVLDELGAGTDVALVSDAGTPLVSDPGHRIVRAAIEAGVRVEAVPGPSALLGALVVSGLPSDRFVFEGFLPRRASARAARIDALRTEARTSAIYEAPHRIGALMAELRDRLGGERRVAVARELTKLHEEVWRGDLAGAVDWIDGATPRGEFVIVLGGASDDGPDDDALVAMLRGALDEGDSRRDAVDRVAATTGVARNHVYELALTIPTS
jgi:16S rRNA (cytidine1402-2'-O)-methyltransferase